MASIVWLVVRSRNVASSSRISWTKSIGDMPSTAAVVRCRVRSLTPMAAATPLICNGLAMWSRTHRSNGHRRVTAGQVREHGEDGLRRAIADHQVAGDQPSQDWAFLLHDRKRQVYVRERGTRGGDASVAGESLALVEPHGGVATTEGWAQPPAGCCHQAVEHTRFGQEERPG